MPEYYRVDRRRQRRAFIAATEAIRLYSEALSRPDALLQGDTDEFWFWLPDVPERGAVRCHVYPVEWSEIPDYARGAFVDG
ncbi:MAG TPA: hypothetical protein VGY48_12070 [Vicinamibacterales bacterium]|nr:hypothetical protein [Vicinamibacterales bacterium]